jgi:hypothetical protein
VVYVACAILSIIHHVPLILNLAHLLLYTRPKCLGRIVRLYPQSIRHNLLALETEKRKVLPIALHREVAFDAEVLLCVCESESANPTFEEEETRTTRKPLLPWFLARNRRTLVVLSRFNRKTQTPRSDQLPPSSLKILQRTSWRTSSFSSPSPASGNAVEASWVSASDVATDSEAAAESVVVVVVAAAAPAAAEPKLKEGATESPNAGGAAVETAPSDGDAADDPGEGVAAAPNVKPTADDGEAVVDFPALPNSKDDFLLGVEGPEGLEEPKLKPPKADVFGAAASAVVDVVDDLSTVPSDGFAKPPKPEKGEGAVVVFGVDASVVVAVDFSLSASPDGFVLAKLKPENGEGLAAPAADAAVDDLSFPASPKLKFEKGVAAFFGPSAAVVVVGAVVESDFVSADSDDGFMLLAKPKPDVALASLSAVSAKGDFALLPKPNSGVDLDDTAAAADGLSASLAGAVEVAVAGVGAPKLIDANGFGLGASLDDEAALAEALVEDGGKENGDDFESLVASAFGLKPVLAPAEEDNEVGASEDGVTALPPNKKPLGGAGGAVGKPLETEGDVVVDGGVVAGTFKSGLSFGAAAPKENGEAAGFSRFGLESEGLGVPDRSPRESLLPWSSSLALPPRFSNSALAFRRSSA